MPQIGGNGAALPASHNQFEELRRRRKLLPHRTFRARLFRLRHRQIAQNCKNDFFSRREASLDSRSAKFQLRIALVKMPRNSRAQIHSVFEAFFLDRASEDLPQDRDEQDAAKR